MQGEVGGTGGGVLPVCAVDQRGWDVGDIDAGSLPEEGSFGMKDGCHNCNNWVPPTESDVASAKYALEDYEECKACGDDDVFPMKEVAYGIMGRCVLTQTGTHGKPEPSFKDDAWAQDGSGYYAVLRSKPTFHWSMWRVKTNG